jgi:membrane protein YqaA with SNARE-associated domain
MLGELIRLAEEYGVGLVQQHGLVGLFIASAAGSTIFIPFSAELSFPILLSAGIGWLPIIVAATAGALAGTLVNYWVGLKGMHLVHKYVSEADMKKAHDLMNRYGWAGLYVALAFPVPLPTDPLTVLAGATRMRLSEFVAVVIAGKLTKYAAFLGLLGLFF